jgi:hypothetical protein
MVSPFTIATRMKAREYIVDMPITDHCTVYGFEVWVLDFGFQTFPPPYFGGLGRKGRGRGGRKEGRRERWKEFGFLMMMLIA